MFTQRHIQSGIDDITSDECWALYLDKLNEAIWPGGKLREDADKPKTEIEKARTRKEAAQALMNAFPGTFQSILLFLFFIFIGWHPSVDSNYGIAQREFVEEHCLGFGWNLCSLE